MLRVSTQRVWRRLVNSCDSSALPLVCPPWQQTDGQQCIRVIVGWVAHRCGRPQRKRPASTRPADLTQTDRQADASAAEEEYGAVDCMRSRGEHTVECGAHDTSRQLALSIHQRRAGASALLDCSAVQCSAVQCSAAPPECSRGAL